MKSNLIQILAVVLVSCALTSLGTISKSINSKKIKHYTLPTAEILNSKNGRAFLVCELLMKSFKKKISWKYEKNCGSRLEVTC